MVHAEREYSFHTAAPGYRPELVGPTLNRQVAIAMEKGEQRITVDPIPYFGNDPPIVSLNGSFQFQWR